MQEYRSLLSNVIYIYRTALFLLLLTIHSFSFAQEFHFEDDVFSIRLNSLNLQMNLSSHEIATKKITQFIYHQKAETEKSLGAFLQEKDYIDSLLKRAYLPEELRYLPLALSKMDVKNVGIMHSAGIWQLPYYVAISYGLNITEDVDERYDFKKATPVAIAYLQKLSERYTNIWDLVIAYANSSSALEAAKIRTQSNNDIWDFYSFGNLPNNKIIPDFITWVYLVHFYQSHHLKPVAPNLANNMTTISLRQDIPKQLFFNELGLNESFFRYSNPTLVSASIPSYYRVHIPEDKFLLFSAKEDSLYAIADSLSKKNAVETTIVPQSVETKKVYYTVKSGDILGQIAKRNNTTVSQLKKWNNLKSDNLSIGQRLIVRQSSSSAVEPKTNTTSVKPANTQNTTIKKEDIKETTYLVESGDNLSKIATKHSTTVAQLREWNNLKDDNISVGQRLLVRQGTSSSNTSSSSNPKNKPASTGKVTYVVKNGDTLGKIAKIYSVSVDNIKKWNNLKSDRIDIGQKLVIQK